MTALPTRPRPPLTAGPFAGRVTITLFVLTVAVFVLALVAL